MLGWRTFSCAPHGRRQHCCVTVFYSGFCKKTKRNFLNEHEENFANLTFSKIYPRKRNAYVQPLVFTNKTETADPSGEDSPSQRPSLRPRPELGGVSPPPPRAFPAAGSACVSLGRQTGLLKCAFNLRLLHKNRMNRSALMKCRPYLYIRLVLPSVCPSPSCLPSCSSPAAQGFLRGRSGGLCPSTQDIRLGPSWSPSSHLPSFPTPHPSRQPDC